MKRIKNESDEDLRRLILMRHAKSSWANSNLSDFDRPLNDRGRRSAPIMGAWLDANDLSPGGILVSTAVRAQETTELVMQNCKSKAPKIDCKNLYLATPEAILDVIRHKAPVESKTVLVVGHNPGLENLATTLAGNHIVMPTAAIAVFVVRKLTTWSIELPNDLLKLEFFVTPGDLENSIDDE